MKTIKMYLRKSRSDGEFETVEEVLARHERQLQEYCTKVYGKPIEEENIYREVVSGETIEDRPLMKRILKEIESGMIESVIVIEPQRLSRGSFGEIDRIVKTFMYTNTTIVTPMKTYDLCNKFDKKMFEQELLRGNDYLEYVKEILTRGRIASVKSGYYIGSILPYGYDKVKVNKKGFILTPNSDAENVKYIFDRFIKGIGTTNLAHELSNQGIISKSKKPWTANMVRNILTSVVYAGYVTYGRRKNIKSMKDGEITSSRPWNEDYIKTKGLHEPLIDEDTFNKVQEMLKAAPGKNVGGNKQVKSPLAGLVKCKLCGSNMVRRSYDKRNIPTLICRTYDCNCVSSDLTLVEDRVVEMLKKELSDYKYYVANYEESFKKETKDYNKRITKINKELVELQEDLQNALVKYNKDKITEAEYNYLKNYTLKEESRLKSILVDLNDKLHNDEISNKKKAIPILEICLKEYYSLENSERHELLCSIVDHINYKKTVNGRWNEDARNAFELELFLKI